jgi:uncharacterized protein (TIGR03083 family)
VDSVAAYTNARHRISTLLRDRGLAAADRRVPACPNWTIHDVTAHLVGVTADALAGNLDGAATEPWTAAQVDKRRHQSLEQILDEWDETGPQLDQAIAGAGAAVHQLLFDTATHEHDIRAALHSPGAHDADSTRIALDWVSGSWSENFIEHGFEPLRIVAEDVTVEAGDGEPVANLTMSRFEALRALSGRRSMNQVAAYDWDADPTLWLPAFTWGPFTPPAHDLVE